MDEFDLDQYKKTWQSQDRQQKYNSNDILEVLNQKSRNYVKYIFWICVAEFIVFGGITFFYTFFGNDSNSLLSLLQKIGLNETPNMKADIAHFNFLSKVLSLVVTGIFAIVFYNNYKKINIESNIKQFILQIFKFKKTVRYFIITNILLLVLFNVLIAVFIFGYINEQNLHLPSYNWWILVISILFTFGVSLLLIYIYYKLLYGIILKKLSKNLEQLKEIEKQNLGQ